MDAIINYFTSIPSSHRAAILVGGLVFFWMIESIIPLFKMHYSKWKHAGTNIFFTVTTIVINFAFAILILKTSDWAVANRVGLLQIVEMPLWMMMMVGLLGLDLIGAYFIHWMQHKVKWMWQFHLVHHSDNHVDTTTANRHHPGESVFRAVFTTLAVLVMGSPMWLVMMYQSISVVLSQFNHANISLPVWLDKIVSFLIVSPNMHKVHHHEARPLTDTNYGNIFAIWDRIFGTFAEVKDTKELVYGLDTHPDLQANSKLNSLLKMPFQPYRPPTK
ncbi:MAG: sterol desaturase family protein [Raineya sp.]|jgi:sterol desaturase/sphingolipid hydroxylase (fatty acid hydroxylase superfamily)|nr:sterol desaturase family protein [Raineya sp.]